MGKHLKIGIQGIEGCFHHEAARRYWSDEQFEVIPAMSFEEEIQILKNREVDYSIIAIENSLAGSIIPNYQLIRKSDVRIVGEISHHIGLSLLGLPGTKIEDLTEVSSHPMALRQCASFLDQYPSMRRIETVDTADSAKNIKERNLKNSAAVAGSLAADLYGLHVIHKELNPILRILPGSWLSKIEMEHQDQ